MKFWLLDFLAASLAYSCFSWPSTVYSSAEHLDIETSFRILKINRYSLRNHKFHYYYCG